MADVAEVSAPVRRVLLISAGASHSIALLCKFFFFPFLFFRLGILLMCSY